MSVPVINIKFDIEHVAPAQLKLFAGDSVQVKARIEQYGVQYVVPDAATVRCYIISPDGGYWTYNGEVSDDGCLLFTFTPAQIQDYDINTAWLAFTLEGGEQSIRYPMQLKIIPTPDLTVDPLPPPTVPLTPEQIAWLASRVPIIMPDTGETWWVKQTATFVEGEVYIQQAGEPEPCPFSI